MNQAIGMIETKGLLALIEATDAMLKSSDIHCIGKKQVGGGLNTVLVAGDVAAVETAVQAGAASVKRLGAELLMATHVIPRPEIDGIDFVDNAKHLALKEEKPSDQLEELVVEETEEGDPETVELAKESETSEIDPKEKRLKELQQMKVTELRKLAKEQANFSIPRKNIQNTSKEKLIKALIDLLIINE